MRCIPFFHDLELVLAKCLGNRCIPQPYQGQQRSTLYRTRWQCKKCGVKQSKLLFDNGISQSVREKILRYIRNNENISTN